MIIGIDLGTTNTLVAALRDGQPALLGPMIPSAVAFDDDDALLVGEPAADRAAWQPSRSARFFKRDMGLDIQRQIAGEPYGPIELSALVLKEARRVAEAELGEPVSQAVITVPAYFQEPQRRATREAGELAGLEVVRMINEPTAAAIAHGLSDLETERTVVVVDLGGGTLDVTVLEIFEGIIEVVGTGGDGRLGGEDFTNALCELACEEAGVDADTRLGALLRARCEEAKVALGREERVRIPLPDPAEERWIEAGSLPLTRALFSMLTAPLLDRIRACAQQTLIAAKLAPEDLHEVLLVGGATRMPALRTLVQELFGREPVAGPDPDHAIALGAALQAALVARDEAVDDVVVTDVLSHTLGMKVVRWSEGEWLDGYYLPILHRNTTLPARRVERVSTTHPRQTEVRVQVFQGEHRYVEQNRLLGEFTVQGIPTGGSQGQPIDVSFAHDLSGLLEVEATIVATGRKGRTAFEQHGALSENERRRALRRLERLKTPPAERREYKALLEKALRVLAQLPPGPRAFLDEKLVAYEAALKSHDLERVERAAEALSLALEQV